MRTQSCFGKYVEWKLRCSYCGEKLACLKHRSRMQESGNFGDYDYTLAVEV